jgi:hypothetical protein
LRFPWPARSPRLEELRSEPCSPSRPRVGEVPYPIVSRRLRDPTEGVTSRASHPLNGQTTHLRTCQALDAKPGPDLWLETLVVARALVQVCPE